MPAQDWFEMADVRRRFYSRASWVPLRCSHRISEQGHSGYEGYESEFYGVGTLAVPLEARDKAESLGWMDVGISHSHAGYVQDGVYFPVHEYHDEYHGVRGEHLVLEQRGNTEEHSQWHLSQDLAITLSLKREGDIWIRPDEGYIEVARLQKDHNDSPDLLEIRSSHLRDYLAARGMALYVTSYRQRAVVMRSRDIVDWEESPVSDESETDRWEGRVIEISEGGMPYGESTAVFHVARTDVDQSEDVPEFGLPDDDSVESRSWTHKHEGKKLYRIEGELWRNEWVEPGPASPIVRGDELPATVHFITDASGKREASATLLGGGKWLWFDPAVMMSLAHRRGGGLSWYTQDTGSIKCSPDYGVHFGVNRLGLINAYAKDVAQLPEWQQRLWTGHNVTPDGGVSEELLASQMNAEPAEEKGTDLFSAVD